VALSIVMHKLHEHSPQAKRVLAQMRAHLYLRNDRLRVLVPIERDKAT
jgi:hypothetical protein